jgi:uncharacterized protein (DUF952 family)
MVQLHSSPFIHCSEVQFINNFQCHEEDFFSGKDDIVLLWYGHVLLHDDISNEVKINSSATSLYSKLVVFSNKNY